MDAVARKRGCLGRAAVQAGRALDLAAVASSAGRRQRPAQERDSAGCRHTAFGRAGGAISASTAAGVLGASVSGAGAVRGDRYGRRCSSGAGAGSRRAQARDAHHCTLARGRFPGPSAAEGGLTDGCAGRGGVAGSSGMSVVDTVSLSGLGTLRKRWLRFGLVRRWGRLH